MATETADEEPTTSKLSAKSSSRFVVVLVAWCLAGVGVLSSVMFAGASVSSIRSGSSSVLPLLPLCSWLALAVMSLRWVQGRRCHWLWPVLGTICGITSAAMFALVFYVYVAAVPLAIYLVYWHLRPSGSTISAA